VPFTLHQFLIQWVGDDVEIVHGDEVEIVHGDTSEHF
jgi:hypothetical protein